MKVRILLVTLIALVTISKAQTIDESFEFDGVNRYHKIYIPSNFTPNMPLVLNLHGYTSNAFQQVFYSSMTTVAESNDFMLVFPEGTTDQYGVTFWNSEIAGEDVDDLGYLIALIDSMIVNYQVDPDRVYMCGMSNGGFMSYYSACEMTDKIAAIASVTGTMNNVIYDNCNPTKSIPVLEIHGTEDATVPYLGFENSGSFQTMMATEDVVDFWVNHNNCTESQVVEMEDLSITDLSTVTHFSYTGGDDGASVELYRVNEGGHTWPGSIIPLSGIVTNHDIIASEVIWDFFNQYDIDGLLSVEDILQETNFTLSPNPMNTSTIVNSSFSIDEYIIYDIQGKVVRKAVVNASQIEIQKEEIRSGLYILEVLGEDTKLKQQLVVQ
jgi:polyhydroxybutyrate depolymerase